MILCWGSSVDHKILSEADRLSNQPARPWFALGQMPTSWR